MSCAEGTLVRTGPKEFTAVEKLFEGADLFGAPAAEPGLVGRPLQFAMRQCVKVKLDTGEQLVCERGHLLCSPGGKAVAADKCLRESVLTHDGVGTVVSVRRAGLRRVVMIHARYAPVFDTNGILSDGSELNG